MKLSIHWSKMDLKLQLISTYLRDDSVIDSCVSLGEGLFPISRGSESQDSFDNSKLSNFCAVGLLCASGAGGVFSDEADSPDDEDSFFSLFASVPSSSLTAMCVRNIFKIIFTIHWYVILHFLHQNISNFTNIKKHNMLTSLTIRHIIIISV